jgi:hypothetical protein
MSEVSGPQQAARGSSGRRRLLHRHGAAGWLVALLALVLLAVPTFVAASCAGEPQPFGAPEGGVDTNPSGGICVGATCPEQCAQHPVPGCSCGVEGQHLLCSKVDATFSDGTAVCGQGISVCTHGVWADCVIDGAVTIVPNAPPGFYAEGLGTGSPCLTNPCDPSCMDFVDTPTGLSNDAGITATDAGLTLSRDGGLCMAASCASLGKNCGPVSDTCGGLLQCGSCALPETCGGAGVPSVCGIPAPCTGLCLQQVNCAGNATTSVTGTVYQPNGTTPLPGALIYVPNGPVQPFAPGVACVTSSNCTEATGAPLISTTSAFDGTFKLTNMPVGSNIPLVIQVGRFRRQVTIPTVTACANTDTSHMSTKAGCLANGKTCSTGGQCCSLSCSPSNGANPACDSPTRLPKNQSEGDIPKMAFVTGDLDALECVWRKIGIDDSEFTNPGGTGRINFYQGGWSGGTYIGSSGSSPAWTGTGAPPRSPFEIFAGTGTGATTPWEDALVGSPATLAQYDMVLFPCQGQQYFWDQQAAYESNIASYVNAGGRVFTTHFSYVWLYSDNADSGGTCQVDGQPCTGPTGTRCCSGTCGANNQCVSIYSSPLSGAINWGINQGHPSPDPQTGYINTSFPKGLELAQWLQFIGASTTLGQIPINTLRQDFNGVVAPTQLWMSLGNGTPMEASFNTPLAAAPAAQCGRVVHSDFHVETSTNTNFPFPQECPGGGSSAQELLLADLLFDLAACVTPDIPHCTPQTCSMQGLNCGMAGDGCGNLLDCGSCAPPQTCGGAGVPGVCGASVMYSSADFVRDYDATGLCPNGTGPVWRLYSWSAITPSDSTVSFSVQTATTLAGLPAAPSNPLLFSNPPGPAALLNQAAVAHAGSPDTELGSASPDYTLLTDGQRRGNLFLRVTAHLAPSSDRFYAPTLSSWDMQIDCSDNQ